MSAVAVRAMFRSHPEKPAHSEAMSRCIDACFSCVETCTACADACLSERDVSHLVACIRLNLDCAAVCNATGNIMARSNKAGHRQLLEAQLANCIAFCRACADECGRHGEMHQHCARLRRGLHGLRRSLHAHARRRCGCRRKSRIPQQAAPGPIAGRINRVRVPSLIVPSIEYVAAAA